jgi:nucleotide-binding universal stress UspA family protein
MEKEAPRIIVGVDFSPASDRAVGEAWLLARHMDAKLDFVHISPLPPSAPELPPLAFDTAGVELAKKSLGALQEAAQRDGLSAEIHLGVGSPVFGLVDFIKRLKPALVVVGSHGRTALMRLLVGSVAESLIRRSPAPVLVVPAPERQRATHPHDAAWSCGDCGHILTGYESTSRCSECGAQPPHWISAPLSDEAADLGEPSVGDEERDEVDAGQRNSPTGLFATSAPGTQGTDINPELRVRY